MKNRKEEYILVVCPNPSIDTFAWIENFKQKETNRITCEESYPGGKGVHVAMAAAEMDIPVKLLGFWGGASGKWIKEECEERYSNIECIGPEVKGLSRTCYTFKSDSLFDDTEILGKGPSVTSEDLSEFFKEAENYISNAKCVVMSGSWVAGIEDGYQALIKKTNSYQKDVFLDCTGTNLENALKESPYLVHLNKSEVQNFTGKTNIIEAGTELLKYCEVAAITDGSKGLHLISTNEHIQVSHQLNTIYSTIGSGDCLTAGLALAYSEELNFEGMAKLGASMGAANCIRKELGLLNKSDVEELKTKSKINYIGLINKSKNYES